jgi:hypothetical protein
MLMGSGSYGLGGRLQSDTLRDLEGTLALAQEMKSLPPRSGADQVPVL